MDTSVPGAPPEQPPGAPPEQPPGAASPGGSGDQPPQAPGCRFVSSVWVILLGLGATVLAVVVLYSLWVFWPKATAQTATSGSPTILASQKVSWFGLEFKMERELLFFLTVALAGGLGGMIHTIRSFTWYVGNRDFRWSWVPYNMLLPLLGSLAGTVFYLVLRAGLFSPSTSVQQASPFGFAAVAILAGLFSPQAFEKLRLIASDIFVKSPKGEDHVAPVGPVGPAEPVGPAASGE